ncbi:hypothetical protein OIU76_020262 [Salix suchowensis]|nr:hypothetical protein OIU76_020262 [Salix suchowensis]
MSTVCFEVKKNPFIQGAQWDSCMGKKRRKSKWRTREGDGRGGWGYWLHVAILIVNREAGIPRGDLISLQSHPFHIFLVDSVGALLGLGRQIFRSGVPPLLHHYQSGPPFFLHFSGLEIKSSGYRLVTSDLSRGQWPITCDMLRLLLLASLLTSDPKISNSVSCNGTPATTRSPAMIWD